MRVRTLFVVLISGVGFAFPRLSAAQDRWQVTLRDGQIVWDLRIVQLAGDTLVCRKVDQPRTLLLPVMDVDVVRLVQKAARRQGAPDGQGTRNGLMGGADLVWQLTLLDRSERLGVIHQILEEHPPGAGRDR